MSRKLNWPFYVQNHVLQKFRSSGLAQQQAIFQAEKELVVKKVVTNEGAKDFNPAFYSRYLLDYVIGEKFLQYSDISFMHSILNPIIGEDPCNHCPGLLLRVMEHIGYVRQGDNIFRRRIESQIKLPQKANAYASRCADAEDVLRPIREVINRNVYAIDSKSTFEVDDGISYHIDANGKEIVTVHVADVTSYCPVDSNLDRISGMKLRTTTYLPEGVWCMLPRKLVDVATLQSNHPCRSFDISFSLSDEGEITSFDVGVSTVNNLRRITYDTCQVILDQQSNNGKLPDGAPSWMTIDDVNDILKLNKLRLLRKDLRTKNGCWKLIKPKPRVLVNGVNTEQPITIEPKSDESLLLRDAYNFVEEFMIAANEACSRIAIERSLSIPYRVTRPLSNRHEEIDTSLPPGAVEVADVVIRAEDEGQLDLLKLAKSITDDTLSMKSVTRAYYSAEIGFHSFLNTSLYCHATSPLRRYADMLVHHQLKSWIAGRSGIHHYSLQTIDLITMKEECRKTSKVTGDIKVLDNQSSYFWALQSLARQKSESSNHRILAIVTSNVSIDASPAVAPLAPGFQFASHIVLCQLLLVVVLYHNEPQLTPGDFVNCTVEKVDPIHLVLKLSLDRVLPESEVKYFYNLKSFTEGFSLNEDI